MVYLNRSRLRSAQGAALHISDSTCLDMGGTPKIHRRSPPTMPAQIMCEIPATHTLAQASKALAHASNNSGGG
jgi:hypothetical protein